MGRDTVSQTGFKHKIEALIRDEGENGSFPLATCLRGLSLGYAAGVGLKNRLYDKGVIEPNHLPCPVISIGNLTVGGTGKTPMTVWLVRHLCERGLSPLILSRGYGGTASETGGMVSDGQQVLMNARQAGDEPCMMARTLTGVPVVVGRNRHQAGMAALAMFSPDVIVLDDGFQHRKLGRDLDILLFDAARPLGNGFLLPRGPLREPLSAMDRAQVFVLTRSDRVADPVGHFTSHLSRLGLPPSMLDKPVFTCTHRPSVRWMKQAGTGTAGPAMAGTFPSGRVFAFSGIADNDDFRRTLSRLGFEVADFMAFLDHHPYSADDLTAICSKAEACGAAAIVTTEKDASRLGDDVRFPLDLLAVGIDMDFGEASTAVIDQILSRAGLAPT